MTTGIIAVTAEPSLLAETNSTASLSLIPSERRIARRAGVLVRGRRGSSRASSTEPPENPEIFAESLASAYVRHTESGIAEKLDVAGQYWFYASMLTTSFYPTISIWA